MKKLGLLALVVVFLAGCEQLPKEMERMLQLRTRLLQAQSVTFDADITADYGDKLHTFSMRCEGNPEGDISFTVTQPETISGITGTIAGEGGKLTFGETALYFDLLTDDQLSPVSAPWILLKTLRSGYVTSAGLDGELLRVSIDDSYDEDALHLDIWLNGEDLPVRAEILYDGRRILSLDVKNTVIR